MLVMTAIFLGSALLFVLLALYADAFGECYSDSPESMRLRVAHHRKAREQARLLRDLG